MSCCFGGRGSDTRRSKRVNPLKRIEIDKYFGKWYQVYTSLTPILTYEFNGKNTTAVYEKTHVPGVLKVTNRTEPAFLPPQIISGWAKQSDFEEGAFSISLGVAAAASPEQAPFFGERGNYWVVCVGEVVQEQYSWAIVTTSSLTQLFILCRNVAEFESKYDKLVLKKCKELGFTSPTTVPRKTVHT